MHYSASNSGPRCSHCLCIMCNCNVSDLNVNICLKLDPQFMVGYYSPKCTTVFNHDYESCLIAHSLFNYCTHIYILLFHNLGHVNQSVKLTTCRPWYAKQPASHKFPSLHAWLLSSFPCNPISTTEVHSINPSTIYYTLYKSESIISALVHNSCMQPQV